MNTQVRKSVQEYTATTNTITNKNSPQMLPGSRIFAKLWLSVLHCKGVRQFWLIFGLNLVEPVSLEAVDALCCLYRKWFSVATRCQYRGWKWGVPVWWGLLPRGDGRICGLGQEARRFQYGEVQCIIGYGHMGILCRQTNRHDRNHYLPATSLAGGKIGNPNTHPGIAVCTLQIAISE